MSGLISSRDRKRAKKILRELTSLTPYGNPRDVAVLLSKTPYVATTVPGLQASLRSKIGRDAMKEFYNNETRRLSRASGKKFRKLRKTRRINQKRRRTTHRR